MAKQFDDATAAYDRRDGATAFRLLHPLAEQGHAPAQTKLGYMYANGQGVPHDYEVAVSWYRKAANQGYVIAQDRLGSIYFNGLYGISKTVRPDYVQAHMWYNLAAAQENFNGAAYSRDQIAARMTPAQIAEAQRLAREWKPKLGK